MTPFPESVLLVPRTLFGRGKIASLPVLCRDFGPHGLLVFGASLRKSGAFERLRAAANGITTWNEWEHPGGEPTLDQADLLRAAATTARADWIAGVGGGSVLDLAKTAAGLFHETAPTAEFHAGNTPARAGIPFLAVPTTAGTGAEATPNAVLTDARHALKKSIRADSFMARAVILDGGLLSGAPADVISHAGLDAYTQALEAYISVKSTVSSDALARAALGLIAASLPAVFADSTAPEADALMAGSHMAGVALAQARLGVIHGLAHPLGAFYHQPHGLVCAVCLPAAIALNQAAMGDKYKELSDAVGGDLAAVTNSLIDALRIRNPFRGLPILRKSEIVEQTLASGSTLANPKRITPDDIDFLLRPIFSLNPEPQSLSP